jgi:nicotinate-nucleotide adenylyltransferase
MRKIALFGSSFNPPHLGHYAVLKDLLARAVFDEIWLVPVYQHPFNKDLIAFEKRLQLVELLAQALNSPQLKISLIEKELGKNPSYMYDTVTALKAKNPDTDFYLIAGSDVKTDLPKWHKAEELKTILKFHFIPRQGYENSPYPQVSSTTIRERAKTGQDFSAFTLAPIRDAILKNKFYA